MAAIDPSTEPEFSGSAIDGTTPRATLKLIRQPLGPDDGSSDLDSEDEDNLEALMNGGASDEDDKSSDDEDVNGGPSDPSKSKKARTAAALDALKKALADGASEDEMSVDGPNDKSKGKAVATGDEDLSSDEDSEDLEVEEFVICTLDPTQVCHQFIVAQSITKSFQHYQQPLDITVGEDEKVFFKVSGTHTIYLTGNYVIPVDDSPRSRGADMYGDGMLGEDGDYDLSPDEDELDEDEESDDLDDLEDPRITELDSEEDKEEVPKLVKKSKNKRPAPESDEEPVGLDEIMGKTLKPAETEPKLSKKQQKKLKNNAGQAVKAEVKADVKAETESPAGKKVQFAKNLEQGPTGSKAEINAKISGEKANGKPNEKSSDKPSNKPKGSLGVKNVRGVTVDDKKLGSGRAAKKGDKISMRYIGKLKDGKQFDGKLALLFA